MRKAIDSPKNGIEKYLKIRGIKGYWEDHVNDFMLTQKKPKIKHFNDKCHFVTMNWPFFVDYVKALEKGL
jgi:hypothetical protein